jgi:hypothetical protein
MTARKKRKTTSSTVAQQMFMADAMDSYFCYILGHKKALFFVAISTAMEFNFQSSEGEYMGNFLVMAAAIFAQKAACMLRFDSELMDLHDHDLAHSGYNKDFVDLTLDHYANDNECKNSTRFSKEEILILLDFLGFGDGQGYIHVYYNGHVYYKYHAVTLFIFKFRREQSCPQVLYLRRIESSVRKWKMQFSAATLWGIEPRNPRPFFYLAVQG